MRHSTRPTYALTLASLLALTLTGCASVLGDDFQEVQVNLQCQELPLRGQCTAQNGRGRWVFSAPGTVQVQNEYGPLEITCKPAFLPQFTVSAPALPTWSVAGNFLMGGVLGAAYDVHKNTALKYPETINITSPSCR